MRSSLSGEPLLASHQIHEELTAWLLKKIPLFHTPATDNWPTTAQNIRDQVLEQVIFRGAPDTWKTRDCPVVWGDTLEPHSAYRIRKLRYEALPGLWIAALLYEPTGLNGPVPVVLNVNGHVGPPGKAIAYKQLRCINLAKRGVLALNPEWLYFGELQGEGYRHNRAGYLDLCGVAGVSVFFLAMSRGLDVLLAHPRADARRAGVTGLSGGGWQTIILSSLDTRVTLSAPNAGYIGLDTRVRNRSDIGDIEQNPADLATIADYPTLTALLAPRPTLLLYNQNDDCCFPTDRARPSVYEPVRPVFEALGAEDLFQFHNNIDPGTHNYDLDNRQRFYRFLNENFFPESAGTDQEIPSSGEIQTEAALTVGLPEDNADFISLARDFSKNLPRASWPHGDPAVIRAWQDEGKRRLTDILRFRSLSVQSARLAQEKVASGLRTQRGALTLSDGWTLPVALASRHDAPSKGVTVITADGGLEAAMPHIEEEIGKGRRVAVVDILFHGECRTGATPEHQWAMMMSAAGERSLGVQTAQLAAAIDWAAHETTEVSVCGVGRVASIVALTASALAETGISRIVYAQGMTSLKSLFENSVPYEDAPSLFCFGLLEAFDIAELIALLTPTWVEVANPAEDAAGLIKLRELYARYGLMGFMAGD